MKLDDEHYYSNWGQARYRKLVPYNPLSNIPIMYTTALLCAYCVITTTFEALKAPFFQQEKVLQFPGHGRTINKPDLVPEEFVTEENVKYSKDVSASEGANAVNRTVKRQTYPHLLNRRNHQRSSEKSRIPLTPHLQPRKLKTSSLKLPMTRPSLCAGTTVLAT
jgi:hypothetical protein